MPARFEDNCLANYVSWFHVRRWNLPISPVVQLPAPTLGNFTPLRILGTVDVYVELEGVYVFLQLWVVHEFVPFIILGAQASDIFLATTCHIRSPEVVQHSDSSLLVPLLADFRSELHGLLQQLVGLRKEVDALATLRGTTDFKTSALRDGSDVKNVPGIQCVDEL